MKTLSKSVYKHLEELEAPREDREFGEYFFMTDFQDYRESLLQTLDKERVVSSFSDLRFLVNSLKSAADQPESLSDIVTDYESRQTNRNLYIKHQLSDGKQLRNINDELRFNSSNPFQQNLLMSSSRPNIHEKQSKEELGKMLSTMQSYLSSNLKEIKNIKSLVEPESTAFDSEFISRNQERFGGGNGSQINDENANTFIEPLQSEMKKFKEDIENTEKRVQEVQIQKLMTKIKQMGAKNTEMQGKLEPLEKERNNLLIHMQQALCMGNLIVTDHTDLSKYYRIGAEKDILKTVTKFVTLDAEKLKFFDSPLSKDPYLIVPHKEVADLGIIDVLNIECNICFKLEYWNDGEINLVYLHPFSEVEASKWDINFYALNIKKSISVKGPLLKNAVLMQATVKAMELIRSGAYAENDEGLTNSTMNVAQFNDPIGPPEKSKSILKKNDSVHAVPETLINNNNYNRQKKFGTQANNVNSESSIPAQEQYAENVINLFKRNEKRESSKKIQFAEGVPFERNSTNNLSQFSRFNVDENSQEVIRRDGKESTLTSRYPTEFQGKFYCN